MNVFEQTSKKAANWLPCLLVPRSSAKLVLLCAVVSLSACDCENRVRKLFSDRDAPAVRKGETLDPKKRSSAPKEQEPNDSPAQATAMVLTSELRAITGQLQQSADRDWFALSCQCKPGETWLLEIRVEPTSAESLTPVVDFELPGQSGVLSYKEVEASSGVLSIPIVAVSAEPIKFAVRAANGQGNYAIRFKRRLSGGVVEAEPNDYAARAWPVKMPGEVQGFFDRKGDRDILALDLQGLDKAKLYTVQVTSPDGGQMMVEWYLDDALKAQFLPPMLIDSGKVGEVPNIKFPADAKTLWLATSAGAFYSRTKPYRVRLVAHPPAAPKTVMEWEPDGQGESMLSVSQTTSIQGYMHMGDEQDQWMLSLPEVKAKTPMDDIEPGKRNSPSGTDVALPKPADPAPSPDGEGLMPRPAPLELTPWPKKTAPAYLVDVLYKAKSEKLFLSATVGQAEATYKSGPPAQTGRAICRQPMAAGQYPITIKAHPQEGLAFDQRQYAALVRVHTPGPEDELEPNQTRQAADPLKPGHAKVGVIAEEGDVDYFVIDLPEAAKEANAFGQYVHSVKIKLAKHPANLQLQVFDAQGVSLGVSNKTGQGGAEVYAGQWQQGRYWVAVSSVRGYVCTPYRLELQIQ